MTITENAEKTAQWWTEQLRTPNSKMENGTDNTPDFYVALAVFAPKADRYSEAQLEQFTSSLIEQIEADIEKSGGCEIGVRYDPCPVLMLAAESAGIELGKMSLPWFSSTLTTGNKAVVSHGYEAPIKSL